VWAKRLEEGTYAMPFGDEQERRREITAQELGALLSGIDLGVRALLGFTRAIRKLERVDWRVGPFVWVVSESPKSNVRAASASVSKSRNFNAANAARYSRSLITNGGFVDTARQNSLSPPLRTRPMRGIWA
jgi:hypothetical protein